VILFLINNHSNTLGLSQYLFFRRYSRLIRSAAAAALLLRAFAAPAQHSIPYAATQPATEITATSARLNGMATPNGSRSTAWFEWGVDGSYDHSTTPMDVGSGYGVVRVSTAVNGLIPGQLYRFRLLVTNTPRTAYGIEQRFVAFAQAGKVTAWGDNSSGQASVPGDLSNIVTVAAGGFHSLALNSAGQVFAWGENGSGQTSVPGNLSNIIALAGGLNYRAVLDQIGTCLFGGSPV